MFHKKSLVSDDICLLIGLLDCKKPFTCISGLFCKTSFKASHNKLVEKIENVSLKKIFLNKLIID